PFAASGCVCPRRGRAEGGLRPRPAPCLPLPLDARELVVLHQARPPELLEEAARLPLLEAAVRGAAAAHLLGQRVPLAPRPQHVDNGAEDATVVDTGAAAAKAERLGRGQRPDPRPDGGGHLPGGRTP